MLSSLFKFRSLLPLIFLALVLVGIESAEVYAQSEAQILKLLQTDQAKPRFSIGSLISPSVANQNRLVIHQWHSIGLEDIVEPAAIVESAAIIESAALDRADKPTRYSGPLTDRLAPRSIALSPASSPASSPSQQFLPRGTLLSPITPHTEVATQEPASRTLVPLVIPDNMVRPASYQSNAELFSEANPQDTDSSQEPGDTKTGADKEKPDDEKESVKPSGTLEFDAVSIQDLTQRIKEKTNLVNNDTADEEAKKDQLNQLGKASAWLQKANQAQALIDSQTQTKETFEDNFKKLEEKIKKELIPEKPGPLMTAEELQTRLQATKAELQTWQMKLDNIEDTAKTREERTRKIPTERTNAQERLNQIKDEFDKKANEPKGLSTELSILTLQAEELARKLEIAALDIESPRQEQIGKRLPKEREWINKNIKLFKDESEEWGAAYSETREREIETQLDDAANLRKAVKGEAELVAMADENLSKVKIRRIWTADMKTVQSNLKIAESELLELDNGLEKLRNQTETKITAEAGRSLVQQRNQLTLPAESLSRIETIESRLQEIRLDSLKWKEEREKTFQFPQQVIKEMVARKEAAMPSIPDEPTDQIDEDTLLEMKAKRQRTLEDYESLASKLVDSKIRYLDALNKDFDDYRVELVNEESALDNLVKKINETEKFINEKALWIQSTTRLGLEDFHESRHGLEGLLNAKQLGKFLSKIKAKAIAQPLTWALGFIVMISLFAVSRRLKVSHA